MYAVKTKHYNIQITHSWSSTVRKNCKLGMKTDNNSYRQFTEYSKWIANAEEIMKSMNQDLENRVSRPRLQASQKLSYMAQERIKWTMRSVSLRIYNDDGIYKCIKSKDSKNEAKRNKVQTIKDHSYQVTMRDKLRYSCTFDLLLQ